MALHSLPVRTLYMIRCTVRGKKKELTLFSVPVYGGSDGGEVTVYGDRELQVFRIEEVGNTQHDQEEEETAVALTLSAYSEKLIRMGSWILTVMCHRGDTDKLALSIGLRNNSVCHIEIDRNSGKSILMRKQHGPDRALLYCMQILYSKKNPLGLVFAGTMFGAILVWNLESGKQLECLHGHNGEVNDIICNDTTMISAGADRSVRWWDINTGLEIKERWAQYLHNGRVWNVCLLDNLIFSAGEDACVGIFDSNGKVLFHLENHTTKNCRRVAGFNGRWQQLLASAGDDGGIKIWDKTYLDNCLTLCSSSYGEYLVPANGTGIQKQTGQEAKLLFFQSTARQLGTVIYGTETHASRFSELESCFGIRLPVMLPETDACPALNSCGNIRNIHLYNESLLWIITTDGLIYLVNYHQRAVLVFGHLLAEKTIKTIYSTGMTSCSSSREAHGVSVCCSAMCRSTGSLAAGAASGDIYLLCFNNYGLSSLCSRQFSLVFSGHTSGRLCYLSWVSNDRSEENMIISGTHGEVKLWKLDMEQQCIHLLGCFRLPHPLQTVTTADFDRKRRFLVVGEGRGSLTVFALPSTWSSSDDTPVAPLARATAAHGQSHITCVKVTSVTEKRTSCCQITSTGADGAVLFSVFRVCEKAYSSFETISKSAVKYRRFDFRPALSDTSVGWQAFTDEGGSMEELRRADGPQMGAEGKSRREKKRLAKCARRRGSCNLEDVETPDVTPVSDVKSFCALPCGSEAYQAIEFFRVGQIRLSNLPSIQWAIENKNACSDGSLPSSLQLAGFYLAKFSVVEVCDTTCRQLFYLDGGGFKRPFDLYSPSGDANDDFVFVDAPQYRSKHYFEHNNKTDFMLRIFRYQATNVNDVSVFRTSSHGRAVTAAKWVATNNDCFLVTAGEDFNSLLWKRQSLLDSTEWRPWQSCTSHITVVNCVSSLLLPNSETVVASGGGKETVCFWRFSTRMSVRNNSESLEWVCSYRRENADLDQRITSLALLPCNGVIERDGKLWEVDALCFCGNTQGELLIFALSLRYRFCDLIFSCVISDVPVLDLALRQSADTLFLALGTSDGAALILEIAIRTSLSEHHSKLETPTIIRSSSTVACEMGTNAIDCIPSQDSRNCSLICGGDDGYVSILKYFRKEVEPLMERVNSYQVAASSIKGLKLEFPFVFVVSLDQRLTIWKLEESSLSLVDSYCCACADVMNVDVRRRRHIESEPQLEYFDIVICGAGVEILQWSPSRPGYFNH